MTPSLFTRRQAARALGYLFLGGSAVMLATLILPHDSMVRDGPLFALTGGAALIGAALLARFDRVGDGHLHAALAAGSLILAGANYFVGPSTLFPLIYCWTALYAFTFFALRAALLHLGRGRGLVMMRAMMDAVDVAAAPGGTTVTLRRRLEVEAEGAALRAAARR